jgi:hypothetical protein
MNKWMKVVVMLVVMTSVYGYSDLIWNFNTNGNYEGWFDQSSRMTDSVTNGTLNYTISSQTDPQWRQETGVSGLDASRDITFSVVVRRTSGTANAQTQFYLNTTLLGSATMANNTNWQTLNFAYTGGTIAGPVTLLRFDPAAGQNGSWAIDSISALQVIPEPASLGLLGIGMITVAFIRHRRFMTF